MASMSRVRGGPKPRAPGGSPRPCRRRERRTCGATSKRSDEWMPDGD
jgi:hypothetical protein